MYFLTVCFMISGEELIELEIAKEILKFVLPNKEFKVQINSLGDRNTLNLRSSNVKNKKG